MTRRPGRVGRALTLGRFVDYSEKVDSGGIGGLGERRGVDALASGCGTPLGSSANRKFGLQMNEPESSGSPEPASTPPLPDQSAATRDPRGPGAVDPLLEADALKLAVAPPPAGAAAADAASASPETRAAENPGAQPAAEEPGAAPPQSVGADAAAAVSPPTTRFPAEDSEPRADPPLVTSGTVPDPSASSPVAPPEPIGSSSGPTGETVESPPHFGDSAASPKIVQGTLHADAAPEAGTATQDAEHSTSGIDERMASLDGALSSIAESVKLLARKNDLTDALHDEVKRLRRGELAEAQSSLIRDLIRVRDQVERLRQVSTAPDDLKLVGDQLVEVLSRAGITRFEPNVGDPFDPSAHNAAGRAPTDDASLDRLVAAVVKPGFRRGDGVLIRAADVEVHHYRAPAAAEETV
jgi:molecular chaperone GrpE (heat shock protein)